MLKYLKAIYDSLYPTVNNEYIDVLDHTIDEIKFEPTKYSYCKFSKKELKLGLQNACDR